jgi:hypothetical protein
MQNRYTIMFCFGIKIIKKEVRPFQSGRDLLANPKRQAVGPEGESDDYGDAREHCRCPTPYAASDPPPFHHPRLEAMALLLLLLSFPHHQGTSFCSLFPAPPSNFFFFFFSLEATGF